MCIETVYQIDTALVIRHVGTYRKKREAQVILYTYSYSGLYCSNLHRQGSGREIRRVIMRS